MQPRRHNPGFSTTVAMLGFALAWSIVSPCRAETGGADADEETLRADARETFKEKVVPFVENYCVRCHGAGGRNQGLNLGATLSNPGITSSFLRWQKAVANVKINDMPPSDARRIPSDEERRQFIEGIGKLKYLSPKDPGPFVIRRLSKVEYGNTLRDLYEVDPSIADGLPEEVVGEGYLNSISPLQSELFLEIANQVVDRVLAPQGEAPTAVQQRLFGEAPPDGADLREEARRVARSLAREAYRRPPTEVELDVLVDVFDLARENKLDYTAALGLDVEGGARLSAISLHHARRRGPFGRSDRPAG